MFAMRCVCVLGAMRCVRAHCHALQRGKAKKLRQAFAEIWGDLGEEQVGGS
jgi:hypothetical protein